MKFYSKVSQDKYLFERFFVGKRQGIFVDIGAHDGQKFNNTFFFEQFLGWRGLCVEPQEEAFKKLSACRSARCEQMCVSDFDGVADFVENIAGNGDIVSGGLAMFSDRPHAEPMMMDSTHRKTRKVPVVKLNTLLEQHRLHDVDYCSISAAGAEFSILSGLDFDKFRISMLTISNKHNDDRIPKLMVSKGYEFATKLGQDLIFRRKDMKPLPLTTVFSAVWHGDPLRLELLRGHMENLKRQTVPIETVYVFDDGDTPPDWLEGHVVLVRESLTIYQAWNVALSLVRTPLVMNLNLDDRLAVNAVELMQNSLLAQGATIIGGDWKICYSQADTDSVETCYDANHVPLEAAWPPTPGTVTRLGSGTGHRGTLGPATLWRMDAHLGLPRYPWRFADGSPIRMIGDAVWWGLLRQQNKKQIRLPMIVGNYYSHPSDQAEFRKQPEDEHDLLSRLGCSYL